MLKTKRLNSWDTGAVIFKISVVALLAFLVGWLMFLQLYNKEFKSLQDNHQLTLLPIVSEIERELGKIKDTLRYLNSSHQISSPLDKQQNIAQVKAKIQDTFIRFGLASNNLSQIRWLDTTGNELLRVNFNENTYVATNTPDLRNKAQRYYFKYGMQTNYPDIYVSETDLNIEDGEIEKPFIPTVRASLKTSDLTHPISGLLIINYNLSAMFEKIRSWQSETLEVNLINQDGYWLLAPSTELEWGFILGKPQSTINEQKPVIWDFINHIENASATLIDDQLVSFHRVNLQEPTINDQNDLLILLTTSEQHLIAVKNKVFLMSLLTGASVFLVGVMVVLREFKFQRQQKEFTHQLNKEKSRLSALNKHLKESILEQGRLQGDLVESRKLASLGSLTAGLAHELNTPLGVAITSVSHIETQIIDLQNGIEKGSTKRAFIEILEVIKQGLDLTFYNLNRAAKQIDNFKQMAIEQNDESLVVYSLKQVANEVVTAMNENLKGENPLVFCHIKKDLELLGRPDKLSQILQYLIDNALQHGINDQSGGIVEVSSLDIDENTFQLVVSDNGKGVPEKFWDSLFQPFITSSRGQGKPGLGLYFVHQWVTHILKGRIDFQSEKGKGTKFIITLPKTLSSTTPW